LEYQLSTKSITGGVGTVFYVAPEQFNKTKHSDSSYGSKADIFSLGVLLFEMFNLRPFATYMERAMTLTTLRGDSKTLVDNQVPIFSNDGSIIGDWQAAAHLRFPDGFCQSVPTSAQQLILWCLERNPQNRPTAKQILTSGLLPRKVELEQRYLDEVLQTLSDPQAEQSYRSILAKLFERPNPKVTFTLAL
jgi:translation initiation factor 2-alpha kinase 4